MRRITCLICALALCLTLAVPVFAASGTFVPSITYKDGPEVRDAVQNGEDVSGCIVVTSIKAAEEKSTDIYQEDRDLLLEIYEELEAGSMVLPLEDKDYVVRELVDISFVKTDCVEVPHGHKEWLAKEDTTITIRLDLGVKQNTDVVVLVYLDGEWVPAEKVVNNGDGTLTCEFEDICPVAFCVDAGAEQEPPKTGDAMADSLWLWVTVLTVSLLAMVILLLNRKRFIR